MTSKRSSFLKTSLEHLQQSSLSHVLAQNICYLACGNLPNSSSGGIKSAHEKKCFPHALFRARNFRYRLARSPTATETSTGRATASPSSCATRLFFLLLPATRRAHSAHPPRAVGMTPRRRGLSGFRGVRAHPNGTFYLELHAGGFRLTLGT
jgi:hypothetical protein